MIARRFEDLVVWQLAHQLQEEVFRFTKQPPTCRDFKFCDQIQDSARSATRNIAEGFGRFYPKEFRGFLRFAAGSLHETKNHLLDARKRGYISPEEFERLRRLALRAIKANNRLINYLRTATPPIPYDAPPDNKEDLRKTREP